MNQEKINQILFAKIRKLEKEIKELKKQKENNNNFQWRRNDDGTYTLHGTVMTQTPFVNTPFLFGDNIIKKV